MMDIHSFLQHPQNMARVLFAENLVPKCGHLICSSEFGKDIALNL